MKTFHPCWLFQLAEKLLIFTLRVHSLYFLWIPTQPLRNFNFSLIFSLSLLGPPLSIYPDLLLQKPKDQQGHEENCPWLVDRYEQEPGRYAWMELGRQDNCRRTSRFTHGMFHLPHLSLVHKGFKTHSKQLFYSSRAYDRNIIQKCFLHTVNLKPALVWCLR
jgi:hypothetical protein